MTEMTLQQRQALALARARRRRAEAQSGDAASQAGWSPATPSQDMPSPERRAFMDNPVAAAAASFIRGVPFVGEYADEAVGAVLGGGERDNMRAARAGFEQENSALATGGQIGTGVAAALAAARVLGPAVMAAAPASMLGRVGLTAFGGATTGAVEGGVSGYGAGDDGDRVQSAQDRAMIGGAFGGAVGAVAPLAAAGARNLVQSVRGRPDAAAARRMGGSPESAEVVGRMLTNDDPSQVGARIAAGGDRAMLGDAGPATAGLLDTAIQRAGPGGRVARDAIEQRAIGSARDINEALDVALGRVPPIDPAATRSAARRAAIVRDGMYKRAYAQPIDYSMPNGRRIEELLPRVPQDAINAANKLMQVEGFTSRQILFDVADDGTVSFRSMPDVRQLDYITRGLNQTAEAGVDAGAMGGRTPVSRAYKELSRSIRNELKDAVPEYRTALERAATDISVKQAQEIGEVALRPVTSRGELAETLMDMGAREKDILRRGVRVHIDDLLSRVRRTAGGDNQEAREGLKAITELTSRENRDKLRMILGDDAANELGRRIDQAAKSFELRARTADNSRTFARQNMDEAISELTQPGMIGELMSGSPVAATRKLVQSMTNMTPQARRAVEERITGEIATILTQRSGREAERAAAQLVLMLERAPVTENLARRIGQAAGATTAVGGYQTGTRLTDR